MSLAEEIMEELQEKQEEMQNCSHETIIRDDEHDEWHCEDCPRVFVPQESHIEDRLPQIEKNGHKVSVVVDKGWNHVKYASKILELIGLEYDKRYVNSGGTFSKAGKRKIYQHLKDRDGGLNSAAEGENTE